MNGYQARWDNSPINARVQTMFARTIRSIAAIGPMESITGRSPAARVDPLDGRAAGRALQRSADSSADAGHVPDRNESLRASAQPLSDSPLKLPDETPNPSQANDPMHRANELPAAPIQPVLAKPDAWSDLIALAGDGHDTIPSNPLRPGSGPSAPESQRHDGTPLFWPAGAGEMGASESDASGSDPLATLTLEYRRALLSQKSGNTYAMKTANADGNGPAVTTRHDPFAELAARSHPEESVFDLLTHGRNIDTLLDSLDAFGADQIFDADEPHEILALLAPGRRAPRRTSQAAHLAREEHHLVSVDSPMSVPDSTEYEEAKSPDEHDR